MSIHSSTKKNAIETVKSKIDNPHGNNKCGLCADGDETINHIISEYIKEA